MDSGTNRIGLNKYGVNIYLSDSYIFDGVWMLIVKKGNANIGLGKNPFGPDFCP
jgi:hypothetical protein